MPPSDLDRWCDELARRGAAPLCVRGTSMAPALRDGDVVIVRAEPPRLGDVAVARRGEALVCHRLLWRGEGRVALKGDGRVAFESLRAADVIGRVPARRPWLAWVASIARIPIRLVRR